METKKPSPKQGDVLAMAGGFRRKGAVSVTVMKVARTYFYVAEDPSKGSGNWIRFRIDDWSRPDDRTNHVLRLYPSMDAYRDIVRRESMRDGVERFFRQMGNVKKLADDDLETVYEILARNGFVEDVRQGEEDGSA